MMHVAIRSHLFRSNIFLKKGHGQMTVESKNKYLFPFSDLPIPNTRQGPGSVLEETGPCPAAVVLLATFG